MDKNSEKVGKAYDSITHRWTGDGFNRNNGIAAHKRALGFAKNEGKALDVGCGCTGRFIDLLLDEGFTPEGVDLSAKKIEISKQRHPTIEFHHADICEWPMQSQYDFITAWDSLWHIALDKQAFIIEKLCSSLSSGGVFIFSFGGVSEAGEHTDNLMGPKLYYSSLGTNNYLRLLSEFGCICRHLEHERADDPHTFIIAQKL
ncbi:MAG: class I SAM-dependent methyltransferase [Pseudohongiellaceae bacterium]|nr:class I SAM-dependent methyltransferase [Pseudohongiellaceae bacterium]